MSQDLFSFPSDSGSIDDPSSQTPVESSGLSGGSSPAPAVVRSSAPKTTAASFICPRCGKSYIRKFYFDKHVIAHDVSGNNVKIPSPEQFQVVIDDLMMSVLRSINEEHDLGEDGPMKKRFLEDILNNKLSDASWKDFQMKLSEPFLKSLMNSSVLLPQNKYQEALKQLNYYLSKAENMNVLVEHLVEILPDLSPFYKNLARRLILRMSHLLLDQIQIFIAKELQSSSAGNFGLGTSDKNTDESKAFCCELGSFLRSLYAKGLAHQRSSKMFRSLCNCLKENFVYMNDNSEPISSKQFLDKSLSFLHCGSSDSEGIVIKKEVIDFFLFVEKSIILDGHTFCSLDDLMTKIYCNREILTIWCSLTQSYFGDENSVYVMKKVVSAFRELSIRLEVERDNRTRRVQSNVALRTDLKRK